MCEILGIIVFATLCLGWGVCAVGCFFCIIHSYYCIFEKFQNVRGKDDWIKETIQGIFMFGILIVSVFLAIGNWSFIPWTMSPWIKWPLVFLAPHLWCIFCDVAIMGSIIDWKKLFKIIFKLKPKVL